MTSTLNRIADERLAAVLSLLIAATALAFANFTGNGENGGLGPYVVCLGASAILAAVLFGRVLPATASPGRVAWILALSALVTVLVFWSGLPFVLGMGALYAAGRADRPIPGALGALAIIAAFVACVIA